VAVTLLVIGEKIWRQQMIAISTCYVDLSGGREREESRERERKEREEKVHREEM